MPLTEEKVRPWPVVGVGEGTEGEEGTIGVGAAAETKPMSDVVRIKLRTRKPGSAVSSSQTLSSK